MADLHRAGSTNKLKSTFEKKIEEANAPPVSTLWRYSYTSCTTIIRRNINGDIE